MRIFSGIRPSGGVHIGNYIGAIKNWVKLQKDHECFYCIVDWHAITTPYKPEKMSENIVELARAYLAAGVNPEENPFFLQSSVKEHAELAWLLGCITPVGELERMTQYKEKSEKIKSPKAGLLNYPVLMAADILLYKTEAVPVGEDQVQHVELARMIARKFNHQFGDFLVEPKVIIPEKGARIMSLSDPESKMSKSGDPKGCIGLFEKPESIRKKVTSAVTDSEKKIKYDPERKPGISNLLTIYSVFTDEKIEEIEKRFERKSYKEFKESLSEDLIESLAPFRKVEKEYSEEKIKEILARGSQKAKKEAQKTMKKVREKMGVNFLEN